MLAFGGGGHVYHAVEVNFRQKFDFTRETAHMKARLYLESLDGRIVPDATPTSSPTNPPVVAQPPEAEWTSAEINTLRAALAQLEQWAVEDNSLSAQVSQAIDYNESMATQLLTALSAEAQSSSGGVLTTLSPQLADSLAGMQPQTPDPLDRVIELVVGLRDLPGNPLANGFRLTMEFKTEINKGITLNKQGAALFTQGTTALRDAHQETDPVLKKALLDAGKQAIEASEKAFIDAKVAFRKADVALTARAPHIQQIRDFLKDK